MRSSAREFMLLAVSCLLGWAHSAQAHEFWLSPSTYRAGPRDTLAVRAYVGTGFRGELRPYATPRTRRFTIEGLRRNDLAPGVTHGEARWALLLPPDDGGQVIAYESDYAFITLAAERFDPYLSLEGLDGPLAARRRLGLKAGPGRERYMRCAKTWVAGRDARRVTHPVGLTIEIVPLADPSIAATLPLRVLYRGKPLASALVRAWNRPLLRGAVPLNATTRDSVAPVEERRTARDGTTVLDVRHGGEWMINVVHMVPSEDRREADWQSAWASLTFARPAAATHATHR